MFLVFSFSPSLGVDFVNRFDRVNVLHTYASIDESKNGVDQIYARIEKEYDSVPLLIRE